MNKPFSLRVVRRGRKLEVSTLFRVGDFGITAASEQFLHAGKKEGREGLDGFMEALLAGKSVDAMFDAMEDRPDLDPDLERAEALERAKKEVLATVADQLHLLACAGEQAAKLRDAMLAPGFVPTIEETKTPAKGEGICRVCHKEFKLHYIGGGDDLCMDHINPGFI